MSAAEEQKPRVVVDTNLFVSATISQRGAPFQLLQAWHHGHFVLLVSAEQWAELLDVFARPAIRQRSGLSDEEVADFLLVIRAQGVPVPVQSRLPVHSRDPKDDHLLAAALAGHADYLVTGDQDLLVLDGRPDIQPLRILSVAEFLNLLALQE